MNWKQIDPIAYRQGWDAALAGKPRESCDFSGAGPRAAWSEGYDAALARSITCVGCGGETVYHEGGLCLACRSLPGTVVRAHKDDGPSSGSTTPAAPSAPQERS